MLSLLHNTVVSKPNYRLFVIHKFPNLKVLDFRKVKDKVSSCYFQTFAECLKIVTKYKYRYLIEKVFDS